MSGIDARSVTVSTGRTHEGFYALARVNPVEGMAGYGMAITLVDHGKGYGSFWLARTKDDPRNDVILMLANDRWEQDARDAGYVLLQKLNAPAQPNTGTPGEGAKS